MEEGTRLGLLTPCVLAGVSPPAPHICQTLLSPQEGGESRWEGPKSPNHQGFKASPKTCNATLCLHVCPPILPGGTQGCCLALGIPSTCFCWSTQTWRGQAGTGTRLGRDFTPQPGRRPCSAPGRGCGASATPSTLCHWAGDMAGTCRAGFTCACGSCGSEREGDTGRQTPTCKRSRGLANTQRIAQHPARTPARGRRVPRRG